MKPHSSSSISFEQLQQLISDIYDAALEPAQWKNVLKKIAATTKAETGSLRIVNLATNDIKMAYEYNKNPCYEKNYKDYYVNIDPWLHHYMKGHDTLIGCTHHHLTNKKYEKLEFYQGLVKPQGTHYGMGGKIYINENSTGAITLNRNRKRPEFENKYLEALLQLVPHLQKALLINEQTQNIKLKQNLLTDALNQINSPLLLVNKNGKVLFINSLAEQLIEQQAGISIKNNHVLILSQVDNKKLQELIHQATHSLLQQGSAMYYTDSATQISVSILISPVNPDMVNNDAQSSENALLVLNTQHQQKQLSVELLTGLYNFTPAEARLATHLCQGLTLDEISEKLSLSKNTLRSQLRSSFHKTGVSRQAELINLVNTGPAGIIKRK